MRFNKLDCVTVVMARNDVFSWQVSTRFNARIEYVPGSTGDLWQFAVVLEKGYVLLAINPCSSEFVGLEEYHSE